MSCILIKIYGVLIENAEDLDVVMPMHNLLEYSKNYSKTSGSLWNYYRDELTDEAKDNSGPNENVINSKSFKNKTSVTGSTYNVNNNADGYDTNKDDTKEVEIAVPLKYLSSIWRTLDIPLINCELFLALSWSATCVITSIENRLITAAEGTNPEQRDNSPTNATFGIPDCKLYVPVVTLPAENDYFKSNLRQDLKEQSNGINIDQKCLIRLKITI